ncbi:glutathione S-transferase [Maricaulis sp. W15]|uniref:glutathione S-transferase family protein n=1 Tax=Maricaulis sp. W15 TaxID=1772333 RepID=UPI000948C6EF|nr:glutathione S-transferase [Maricaulis sp. W15]OLF77655.1 glutathione S-transferase [Maricaulis sp. W15]
MITVHHLNNSRSQRILWLLEEIGLEYEIKKYQRDAATMRAPKALRDVHPLGKSPVISDGDIVVAESGAIVEYLVDTYAPALKPEPGGAGHREYVYWMHFAEGSLMTPLLVKLLSDQVGKAKAPFFFKPVIRKVAQRMRDSYVDPELSSLFAFIETRLEGRDWIAGDSFSGADIQLTFPLEAAAARGGLDARYPNLQAYVARMHARPAYKAAIERGGAYGIVGS